jgi:hypothetical protein
LLNNITGLLNIAKTGKHKRVAIIYTDAWWYSLTYDQLNQCIDVCEEYDITFYTVIYSRPEAEPNGIKASLRQLSEATGGKFFDGITSFAAAEKIALDIQGELQELEPCTIEWESKPYCSLQNIALTATYDLNSTSSTTYPLPDVAIARLKINPIEIVFHNKEPLVPHDSTITLTAINSDFNITNH